MSSQYIAESYISFEDIEVTPLGEQIMMNLSRPEYTGMFSRGGKFSAPNKNKFIFRFRVATSPGIQTR